MRIVNCRGLGLFSIVTGRSFERWCKKKGVVRRTADRHLENIFQQLAGDLRNNSVLLQMPDTLRLSMVWPKNPLTTDMMGESLLDDELAHSPTAWMADGAKPKATDAPLDIRWARRQWNKQRAKDSAQKALDEIPKAG